MPLNKDPTSTPRSSYFALSLASVLLLGLAIGGAWVSHHVAMVPSSLPANLAVEDDQARESLTRNAHAQLRLSASGPQWREMSEAQRNVLAPLHERWSSMGALAKRRWLVLADRYPKMDTAERNRLASRMATWASLSAQQRNQARLNFENTKGLSAKELQAKWDEYQALTEAEKKRLAEQSKNKTTKKAKRRLAQPAPRKTAQAQPAPASAMPAVTAPTEEAAPAVLSTPVHTPQAAPQAHIAPSTTPESAHAPMHPAPMAPQSPEVASQAVTVPQAAPALELPPLPALESNVSTTHVPPEPAPTSGTAMPPFTPSPSGASHSTPLDAHQAAPVATPEAAQSPASASAQ